MILSIVRIYYVSSYCFYSVYNNFVFNDHQNKQKTKNKKRIKLLAFLFNWLLESYKLHKFEQNLIPVNIPSYSYDSLLACSSPTFLAKHSVNCFELQSCTCILKFFKSFILRFAMGTSTWSFQILKWDACGIGNKNFLLCQVGRSLSLVMTTCTMTLQGW